MAENQKLRVDIIGDSSKLNQALGKAEGKLRQFSGKLKNIGRTLSTRVTLPLAAAGGAAIKLASDMEESLNKVDVSFGDSAEKVKEFAKTTLREFGIAESSALEMTALFGDMATGIGITQEAAANMSIELAGLAGDLASFKNISVERAQSTLKSVFNGETEALKNLGIIMTQANLDAFALSQGINKQVSEMTEAEKVNLRLAFVMDRTRNAQGDFARTSGGAANQMRIFQESVKEIGAELGQVLLPAFTKIVTKTNELLKSFRGVSEETKKLVVSLGLGTGLAGVLAYIAGVVLPPVVTTFKWIFKFFTNLNPIVRAVTASLTLFAGVVNKISKETNVSFFETLGNVFKSLGNPIAMVANQTKSMANSLKEVEESVSEDTGISELTNDIIEADTQARALTSTLEKITTNGLKPMTGAAIEAGEMIRQSINPTIDIFKNFGQQILPQVGVALADSFAAIADGESPIKRLITFIKALTVRLVAAAAAAAVLTFLLPGGGSKAAKGLKFAETLKNLLGMKNGGLVFGQTPVMVGDYSGVRSNPEVIAPLNKLQSMIDRGGSQNVTGEFVLRGQDLVVALQRAERNRNRFK